MIQRLGAASSLLQFHRSTVSGRLEPHLNIPSETSVKTMIFFVLTITLEIDKILDTTSIVTARANFYVTSLCVKQCFLVPCNLAQM